MSSTLHCVRSIFIYCKFRIFAGNAFNQNQRCAAGHKTHFAWQFYKTTERRTWYAEPRNAMFSGCSFSVKVLTVIMSHWWYAETREAFNLSPCNCEPTTRCGISTFTNFYQFGGQAKFVILTVHWICWAELWQKVPLILQLHLINFFFFFCPLLLTSFQN